MEKIGRLIGSRLRHVAVALIFLGLGQPAFAEKHASRIPTSTERNPGVRRIRRA